MKKVNKPGKKNVKNLSKTEEVIRKGKGKFNFSNGDTYEGEYIVINNKEIYRHGCGVYTMSNQDKYRALWNKDHIVSNFHVFNTAEYKGGLDDEGAMCGEGTYVFPDGSSLRATWRDNEPEEDYAYMDPLGYEWQEKQKLSKTVIFAPANYIRGKCTQ